VAGLVLEALGAAATLVLLAVVRVPYLTLLTLVPALAIIVAGATGMVTAALRLSDRWSVPDVIVGIVVLAVLASLPNAFTAGRLAFQGRGSALLSETLNSNTTNLVSGILVPARFV